MLVVDIRKALKVIDVTSDKLRSVLLRDDVTGDIHTELRQVYRDLRNEVYNLIADSKFGV
jgi:hypothetical protein